MIRRVAVLGLGLIGGSLARRLAGPYDLVGFDADPVTRAAAASAGLAVAASVAEAVRDRDLVVVATPLPAIGPVLAAVAAAGTHAIVTDVGSVKGPVLDTARTALGRGVARFVGGHPMAGTEQVGFAASDPGLFDGAAWVLTLDPDTDLAAWLAVAQLVTGLGCRVVPCSAPDHDAAVARVSGLPHLLATALALAGADGGPLALGLAAGSFRDGTRVAGSRPELIAALCDANPALPAVLDAAVARLAAAGRALHSGGTVADLAEAGHAARQRWLAVAAATGAHCTLPRSAAGLRDALLALGAAGGHVTAVTTDEIQGLARAPEGTCQT